MLKKKTRLNAMISWEMPSLAEQLQCAGIRPTVGRVRMLAAIIQIGEGYHYPEDILRELLRQDRLVSITAIYRMLADLTSINFLQRTLDVNGKAKYQFTYTDVATEEICLTHEKPGHILTVSEGDSELIAK